MAMRALIISAIVLVAVIMGISAVASAILPEAEAHPRPRQQLPEGTCDAIRDAPYGERPASIQHILDVHCNG